MTQIHGPAFIKHYPPPGGDSGGATGGGPGTPPAGAVFFDDFTGSAGSALGSSQWTVNGTVGANNWYIATGPAENATPSQYVNSTANVYMDGASNLVIATTAGTGGYDTNTAEISTTAPGSTTPFSATWGTFSARIKVLPMVGYWPAWWAEGATGTWPAHGEIDCVENFGTGWGQGLNVSSAGLHGGGPWPDELNLGSGSYPIGDGSYHVYTWVIPSDYASITFKVDGSNISGGYNPVTLADWIAHATGSGTPTSGNFPFGATFPYRLILEVNTGAGGVVPVNPAITQRILFCDWVAVTHP